MPLTADQQAMVSKFTNNIRKSECPQCGFKFQYCQFSNGKGQCTKCNQVIVTKESHPWNRAWAEKMCKKFVMYNNDSDGSLDFEEMSALLLKGNPNFTESEMRSIFDGADTSGDGKIQFFEFIWYLYGNTGGGGAPSTNVNGGGHFSGSGAPPARAMGEACANKFWSPSDAMESDSGVCPKNNGGPHHWKFGACSFCHKGQAASGGVGGGGQLANPGGHGGGCPKGGKCMFFMAKCKKCGKREF
jgi:hypothetical protein